MTAATRSRIIGWTSVCEGTVEMKDVARKNDVAWKNIENIPISRSHEKFGRPRQHVPRSTARGCLRGIDKDIERSADFIEELQRQGDVSDERDFPENLDRFF